MPNKSDSAGKLHQYYTCKQIEKSSGGKCFSPLDDKNKIDLHLNCFNQEDLLSLENIGVLSGDFILKFVNSPIIFVEDIGVASGVIGIENTDDLIVTLINGKKISFSLKCAKNLNQILSKNMGAKSLLKEYFNAHKEQIAFNLKMSKLYLTFLNCINKTNFEDINTVKKFIIRNVEQNKLNKARFNDTTIYPFANSCRVTFLNSLRNLLFDALNSLEFSQLTIACNLILDTGKNHILAEYNIGKEKIKYVNRANIIDADIRSIGKRGNDSVTIIINDCIIGFRFKFESGFTSSIKLVGDYKKF